MEGLRWTRKHAVPLLCAFLLSLFMRLCMSVWGMQHGLYWLSWAGFPGGLVMIFVAGPHGDTNAFGDVVFVLVNAVVYFLLFRAVTRWIRWVKRALHEEHPEQT
jgi:hypothetical protein